MCGLNKSFKNLKPFIFLIFLPLSLSLSSFCRFWGLFKFYFYFWVFWWIFSFLLLLLPYTTPSPFFFQAHAAHCLTHPSHQRDTCRKAGEHIWSELVRGNLINVTSMKDDRNLRGFSFPLFSNCAWGAIAPHCRADKLNRAEKRTVTVWMGETANNSVSDSETQQCCHRILRGTCWVQLWRVPSTSCQPLRCVLKSDRQLITFISLSGTLGFPSWESFTTHM